MTASPETSAQLVPRPWDHHLIIRIIIIIIIIIIIESENETKNSMKLRSPKLTPPEIRLPKINAKKLKIALISWIVNFLE